MATRATKRLSRHESALTDREIAKSRVDDLLSVAATLINSKSVHVSDAMLKREYENLVSRFIENPDANSEVFRQRHFEKIAKLVIEMRIMDGSISADLAAQPAKVERAKLAKRLKDARLIGKLAEQTLSSFVLDATREEARANRRKQLTLLQESEKSAKPDGMESLAPIRPTSRQPGYVAPSREGKVSLKVFVDPDLRKSLKGIAVLEGVSIELLVTEIASSFVEQYGDGKTIRQAITETVQSFASGRRTTPEP